MRHRSRFYVAAILLLAPVLATAADLTRPALTPPPPAVSSGSIVQIIFSLLLVLAAIVLVAWLLKRVNATQLGAGNQLKVLGSVALGQRERIVLVEVKDTWLVVGVGPGQIRNLHTLQKQDIQNAGDPSTAPLPSENKFAKLLGALLHHQSRDGKLNAP
ncbi:MAG: flagellar biosynthetic protein FliO [Gallionella sp.]